jgi:hypothetical protein
MASFSTVEGALAGGDESAEFTLRESSISRIHE